MTFSAHLSSQQEPPQPQRDKNGGVLHFSSRFHGGYRREGVEYTDILRELFPQEHPCGFGMYVLRVDENDEAVPTASRPGYPKFYDFDWVDMDRPAEGLPTTRI